MSRETKIQPIDLDELEKRLEAIDPLDVGIAGFFASEDVLEDLPALVAELRRSRKTVEALTLIVKDEFPEEWSLAEIMDNHGRYIRGMTPELVAAVIELED